ncbi:MAG: nucleotidyltransferase domain-containing protein [Candidatus Korarchaeota archaeon]|nr:nucleotidyltransferase domain-containing protein [Candidatus Korarchaeota archaeon]
MFEHLIDLVREEEKYRKDPIKIAKAIKEVAEEMFGEVRVYLFGSVAEGEDTPSSDMDIMVVSREVPKSVGERSELVARILEVVGVDAPVEIHLLRPEEEDWYLKFVKKRIEVK